MTEEEERPRWSVTWLLRIQRVGRNRASRSSNGGSVSFGRIFPWIVLLALMVFIAVGVWMGLIPR